MTVLALAAERQQRYLRMLVVARAAAIAFCAPLVLLDRSQEHAALRLVLLAGVAVVASQPIQRSAVRQVLPVLEGITAALLMVLGGAHPTLAPYLLVPPVAAGLMLGTRAVVLTTGLSALTASAAFLLANGLDSWLQLLDNSSQWLLTTLVAGLLAARVRHVQSEVMAAAPDNAPYLAAYQLIGQLRTVARQLSGGLDSVGLATTLLQTLATSLPYDVGAVYVRSGGDQLIPLAVHGAERVQWDVRVEAETVAGDAWLTQEAQFSARGVDGAAGAWCTALPLRMGMRSLGVVLLETRSGPFGWAEVHRVAGEVDAAALRLETALLFDDVRSVATEEERRRLAREIHDGIAQELASLGYLVDELQADVAAGVPAARVKDSLGGLRDSISTLVTELRLSIFDLRSEVGSSGGLGTALSQHVRQAGARSGLTVHLALDEGPVRLRHDVETELLRIAQEAIANARRHARAQNLWVTCRVQPPEALLVVEDDGVGLREPREDSFGLQIMKERAARIGGVLTLSPRVGGGTSIAVRLAAIATVAEARGRLTG